MYFSSKNQQPTMSGGITMSKALLNTKPRYPREGKSVHPLPAGIFVEMPATSNEFDDWTEKDFDDEIDRLNKRLKELDSERVHVQPTPEDDDEYDSDDIMNDPDVRKMVENGEHICHMFDGECLACEMEEEDYDGEVRVLTEEEVQNDPEMTAIHL
jgi:hypothetical protein